MEFGEHKPKPNNPISQKQRQMKRYKSFLLHTIMTLCVAFAFTACSDDNTNDTTPTDQEYVEGILKKMSLREKVGQMFWIRPEYLIEKIASGEVKPSTKEWPSYNVTSITSEMKALDDEYPAGGVILFAHNCVEPQQLKTFVSQIKELKNSPLLCIDEEGGRVARLANNDAFGLNKYTSMTWLCQNGGAPTVYNAANYIGSYLKDFGFDVDFAPVADVNSNPDNPVIGVRAFSSDPDSVAMMVCSYLDGLSANGITGCIKHFPGHGDTKTDTHLGYAETLKTWDDMLKCEMTPFKAGIQHGVETIMTAHITAPNVDGSNVPSTLSSIILQDKLRKELGYNNIIVTDAMEMGAITDQYAPEDAAVKSIQAGVDVVLCIHSYKKAFNAVVEAVNTGAISEERINESVRRILLVKKKHGKI